MVDGVAEIIPRGSVVDVRLKVSMLDARSRRTIAGRLKSRAKAAYAQIRGVETYTNLSTCRREHLLRHFGDTEPVVPCGACDVCLGEAETPGSEPPRAAPETNLSWTAVRTDGPISPELFERLKRWRGEQARRQQVPAYVVLHNSHLEEIAARKPQTIHELGSIKGIGLRRAARYGEELLALVRGEEAAASDQDGDTAGYRPHLEAADRLIRSGRGAEAVSELARALELGGDAAKEAVNELLKPTS
jgi:ATP-dependent DNA helicase RecQ